jgi:hypothetical protein
MRTPLIGIFLFLAAATALAQDRATKVRSDRERFRASTEWIYNDLDSGIRAAREANRPLLVVFRCIPCEACQEFDDDVARRDPIIRDLLDRFVCVRIPQANTMDLARFQHDFDLSFAVHLMNADGTIYGRFATRSERPEEEDITLEGLRRAMELALELHAEYPANRESLAGKQPRPTQYKTPREIPSLAGKYTDRLDYEGQVVKSCIHCHQIREAERLIYREAGEPIPDPVLYPYPDPAVLGLKLDPKEAAEIERVAPDSIAEAAGLEPGDEIVTLAGQPMLSIADVQWVLHNTPSSARLSAEVRRGEEQLSVRLELPEGWRRGNISWRATTWDLRRMGLGGMFLKELTDEERPGRGLSRDGMALRIEHLGQYSPHDGAKRAGFEKDDVLIAFDGLTRRLSESDLLAHALQRKRPGDEVPVTVLRNGAKKSLTLTLQ